MRLKTVMLGIAALGGVALGTSAVAQDFTGNLAGDFAMTGLQHHTMESALGINQSGASRERGRASARGGRVFVPVRAGVKAPAYPFQSTPASRKVASDAYFARAERSNAAAARSTAAELAKHDYNRIYASLLSGTGLRTTDAADAVAAYTILGWMIATGSPHPTQRQAQAVRTQIAQRAGGNSSFTDPVRRARLGEEMKLLLVTVHGGWQSARRDGGVREYADGVAGLFRRSDIDLRALRITDQGFAAR